MRGPGADTLPRARCLSPSKLGQTPPQTAEHPTHQSARAVLGRTVVRPQDDRDEILLGFVVERQRRYQWQITPNTTCRCVR